MAKDWKRIYTNAGNVGNTDFRKFNKAIRNTVSLSAPDLKKYGNECYDKQIAEEDKLIAAVEAKRATKPEQVKRAESIVALREKSAKKKEKNKDGSN